MISAGRKKRPTAWRWYIVLFVIFLFVSVSLAETEEEASLKSEPSFFLAQGDTYDDAMDDLDFLDEEDDEEIIQVADPLKGFNKAMFAFNDKAYLWVLKPVAQGYEAVVPKIARKGVTNFFHNLGMPIRFVSCVLQGKGRAATNEFGRFFLNSTVGVLGFGNPAGKYPHLNPDAEDLGQTFGRWGIGNGIYLYLPILGPSTLRDSVGDVGDWFLDPLSYLEPATTKMYFKAGKHTNELPGRIDDYESLKSAAIDPYAAFRDAYVQYRRQKVLK